MTEKERILHDGGKPSRYLLVSTPRSGNTWLRRMLAMCLQLNEYAVHRPLDFAWREAPARYILQLHWHREPRLLDLLDIYNANPITICRHPLDVLISILHFCRYEEQTAQWLGGEGGTESALIGVSPLSNAFASYALSQRAKSLLSISAEWISYGATCVRYEELVRCTEDSLRILPAVSSLQSEELRAAIEANSLNNLRAVSSNHHFWQGTPGLWRQLVSAPLAQRIAQEHRSVFQQLGYDVGEAKELADYDVLRSWNQLAIP